MLVDHRVLARRQGTVVEAHAIGPGEAELNPLLGHPVQEVRRLEQRLGGDAAPVQAGAAQLVALDEPYVHAQLCGADGAHIAHPASQDQEVKGLRLAHAGCRRARSRPSWVARRSRQSWGTAIGLDSA